MREAATACGGRSGMVCASRRVGARADSPRRSNPRDGGQWGRPSVQCASTARLSCRLACPDATQRHPTDGAQVVLSPLHPAGVRSGCSQPTERHAARPGSLWPARASHYDAGSTTRPVQRRQVAATESRSPVQEKCGPGVAAAVRGWPRPAPGAWASPARISCGTVAQLQAWPPGVRHGALLPGAGQALEVVVAGPSLLPEKEVVG